MTDTVSENENGKLIECPYCNRIDDDMHIKSCEQSFQERKEDIIKCPYSNCNEMIDMGEFLSHFNNKPHDNELIVQCPICELIGEYKLTSSMKDHIAEDHYNHEPCIICYDRVTLEDTCLKCGCIFHEKCIKKWSYVKHSSAFVCPLHDIFSKTF